MKEALPLVAKIVDRLLLFLYSLCIGVISIAAILLLTNVVTISYEASSNDPVFVGMIAAASVLFLLSLRFLYISIKRDRNAGNSIDQRTEYGDIQISVETIENLAYKAAATVRGVRDIKTRIRITEAGLEIKVRALVDGETPIPDVTEEVQRQVHDYVKTTTGIPVAYVSVFIANLVQSSPMIKSRVE